jgi:hypothetical protein
MKTLHKLPVIIIIAIVNATAKDNLSQQLAASPFFQHKDKLFWLYRDLF